MEKQPLISIVIPVYNVETYIRRCVDSVISQSYDNLEIFLVDDGSIDHSGEICDEYAKKDKRIRVIHKKNGGLSDARNAGLNASTADYIAFVDSDDFVHCDYIKILYNAMRNYDLDIVVCGYISGHQNVFPKCNSKRDSDCFVLTSEEALRAWHGKYKHLETVAWNKLYKKKLFALSNVCYPSDRFHEDVWTTHQLVAVSFKIGFLEAKLYYYYQRSSSITDVISQKGVLDSLWAQDSRLQYFKIHGYEEAYERLFIKRQKYCMLYYCRIDDKNKKELSAVKKRLLHEFNIYYKVVMEFKKIQWMDRVSVYIFKRYYDVISKGFSILLFLHNRNN